MQRLASVVLFLVTATASALTPEATQKLVKDVTPSLVAVQYTYDGELGRRDLVGAGLVVGEDGLVMTSIALMPNLLPDEQMKDFKIIIPGDELKEIDAVFVGRDERSNVSFVRAKAGAKDAKPSTWKAVKFEEQAVNVGDEVVSVGMMGRTASYQAYVSRTMVSANLRGESHHVLVNGEGLSPVGSPVFNSAGKAIGWVPMQQGQVVTLNDPNPQTQLQSIYAAPRMFVPTREFAQSLAEPPVAGKALPLPWLGVAQMKGLTKDVAEFFSLTGQPAVQVGDVIKGTPAEAAGLKPGNIITQLNGKPLERGDEPDEAAMILMKNLRRMKVGSEISLSVIAEANKPAKEMKIKLSERPKQQNQAKRFYAEDLGFTAREIVFDDTYGRKLPADQKGVVIALLKPSSAAQTGKLERGDLITKLNQTPVTDVEQFKAAYQEFRKAKPKEAVVLEAIRQGNDEIVRIEPPQ